jgi:hypothetical protein
MTTTETCPASIAMKRLLLSLLMLSSLSGLAGSVWAQPHWRDLPPDERRVMRQQMREHWQRDREMRRRDDDGRRWRDVPPEDRRQMRDDMREQRGRSEYDGGNRGGRGGRRD